MPVEFNEILIHHSHNRNLNPSFNEPAPAQIQNQACESLFTAQPKCAPLKGPV